MRERKWTSEEMFPLLSAHKTSGQSRANFCQQHNLSKASYYYWHRRWNQSRQAIKTGFVPVEVNEDAATIVLELRDGLRVRLYPRQLPEVLSAMGYAG